MKCLGDLHIHTLASDGVLKPEEVLKIAEAKGLEYLAIADHDTFLGVTQVQEILVDKNYNVKLIPAVEISTDYYDEEIHILGYFNEINSQQLSNALAELNKIRETRINKIVDKLSRLGFPVSKENVLQHSIEGTVGRPHIAREMIDKGYVETIDEAFTRYLANGKPAYVKRHKLTPQKAIDVIIESGGVPVWAHPGITRYPKEILYYLKSLGLKGVELYHPSHTINFEIEWRHLLEKHDFIITGGSDFHDFDDNNIEIGAKGIGCHEVERLIDNMTNVKII